MVQKLVFSIFLSFFSNLGQVKILKMCVNLLYLNPPGNKFYFYNDWLLFVALLFS